MNTLNASQIQELKTRIFPNEDAFQSAAITFIQQFFPMFRGKVFHAMNEMYVPRRPGESDKEYQKRTAFYGSQNKGKGKLAGVPDICIKYLGILYSIELKMPKGVVSEVQEKVHLDWALDFPEIQTYVARSMYDVYQYCQWILKSGFRITRVQV